MNVSVENIQSHPTAVSAKIEEIRPESGFAFRLYDADGKDLNPAGSYSASTLLDALPLTEEDVRAAIYIELPQEDAE